MFLCSGWNVFDVRLGVGCPLPLSLLRVCLWLSSTTLPIISSLQFALQAIWFFWISALQNPQQTLLCAHRHSFTLTLPPFLVLLHLIATLCSVILSFGLKGLLPPSSIGCILYPGELVLWRSVKQKYATCILLKKKRKWHYWRCEDRCLPLLIILSKNSPSNQCPSFMHSFMCEQNVYCRSDRSAV